MTVVRLFEIQLTTKTGRDDDNDENTDDDDDDNDGSGDDDDDDAIVLRSYPTYTKRIRSETCRRAPQRVPWPDGGPESLRSPCCGLAINKTQTLTVNLSWF
ncbi:hypothetical protein PoB_002634900 [Plakobranchus ocellatus]|uniref:Uncharacterized protein n=1 Tax=Plakobranchus ocellatus TaxID=259542 RepID=A0AAV3ZZQ8_9GAST|nr:hypothetical protein PoB_002634900 [Plakobranchus ocellatus]